MYINYTHTLEITQQNTLTSKRQKVFVRISKNIRQRESIMITFCRQLCAGCRYKKDIKSFEISSARIQ